jgi:hypothetical protein
LTPVLGDIRAQIESLSWIEPFYILIGPQFKRMRL